MTGAPEPAPVPPRDDAGLPLDPRCAEVVVVDGTPIRWGVVGRVDGGGRGDIVLVHGLRANHYWWEQVVPRLEADYRIIWLDLAGNGASGHRASYSAASWSDQVMAVLDAAGSSRAVIVGHSLGGRVCIVTVARHPERFAGLVLLDSKVWARDATDRPQPRPDRERVYPSAEVAIERFRVAPPQPMDPGLRETIARYSIRPHAEGVTWRFDQTGMPTIAGEEINDHLERLTVPVEFVYGTSSALVGPDAAEIVAAAVPTEVRVDTIEGGHHHLSLDKPEASAERIAAAAARLLA